ncbi:MAG: hypothetical protein HQL77_13770 [Magnetococcales bacterium]|nr:hypothetical protein [Magnetococcales bacterium]
MSVKDQSVQLEGEEDAIMRKILILEEEVQTIKAALQALPSALDKEKAEIRNSLAALETLQKTIQEVSHTQMQSNKVVDHLERRVEVVKKDATSGFVISTVIFSILVLLSLFSRS